MGVMERLDLIKREARCSNCGGAGTAGSPPVTIAIDWRTDLLCSACVASFDWSGWTFDPALNVYWRNGYVST